MFKHFKLYLSLINEFLDKKHESGYEFGSVRTLNEMWAFSHAQFLCQKCLTRLLMKSLANSFYYGAGTKGIESVLVCLHIHKV